MPWPRARASIPKAELLLPLPLPVSHQQQAAFVGGIGDAFVDDRLLALHARQVAFVAFGGFAHQGSPLAVAAATRRQVKGGQTENAQGPWPYATVHRASPSVMPLAVSGRSPGL
ncbi:hypothetical protein PPS11_13271 [Pseudomonas putida S11]|nr:hypothetical protein PPS11_13271 [Pseudomonas putida S11]